MKFAAVIVAAGAGRRAGEGPPKQWRNLGGRAVLAWSVERLAKAGAQDIVVVVRPEDERLAADALMGIAAPWRLAHGGEERSHSVASGLSLVSNVDAVLIHDAARPFVSPQVVARLLAALADADGAIPALPVADTLKRLDGAAVATVSRDGLWRAQTPQAFRLDGLRRAYASGATATDDAALVEAAGGKVRLVAGDPALMKLTYPEDFAMAEALAGAQRTPRTGMGYDAHRFGDGDAVWLCGVRIDHDQGLIGHSDADVGLHALTDAVLGAIGDGDIGDHFPPTDPQWKGASSDRFLAHAAERVARRGGRIVNVDVILVCEAPKIKPHRQAMRERIAQILAIDVGQVSVKATTTEGMGFTGRREGLAAQAVATVVI